MKKNYSCTVIINIVLVTTILFISKTKTPAQSQTSIPKNDPWELHLSTNAPPKGFTTRLDYIKSFKNEKEINDAHHAGLISDEETELALSALQNKVSMDTYGKAVDQNGNPLAGVKVRGELHTFDGYKTYYAETDTQGLFNFVEMHGNALYIHPQKQGFEFNENLLPERPQNYLPNPANPLIFTMWKLKGAEPMIHKQLHAYIPCDGTVTRFDLLTGKKNPDGDLSVSLTRNPLNIGRDRNKPFDWSVTFVITNGGLQEVTNLYPYEALAEGYQSTVTVNFTTNMAGWQSEFQHAYYFKSKNGQVYGRIAFDIYGNFQPPPTLFDAEIYANPNASRNLEYDPQKEIR